MNLVATPLNSVQNIVSRYTVWAAVICYTLLYFHIASYTRNVLDVIIDFEFNISFAFILTLAFVTDRLRGGLQKSQEERQEASYNLEISRHGEESLRNKLAEFNGRFLLVEAEREEEKKEMEECKTKNNEHIRANTKPQRDNTRLLKQLSDAEQGRIVADRFHRKRINGRHIEYYTSLIKLHESVINTLENVTQEFKKVASPSINGPSQAELRHESFIVPLTDLSQRLYKSRVKLNKGLDTVKRIDTILRLQRLPSNDMDSLVVKKVENDLRKADNEYEHLFVGNDMVDEATAASMKGNLERNDDENERRIARYCKALQDADGMGGYEGDDDLGMMGGMMGGQQLRR